MTGHVIFHRSDYSDYGSVLFISSLEHTPDGRSLVTTVGEKRFQVLERTSMDGYAVARIRFITDEPVQGDEAIGMVLIFIMLIYNYYIIFIVASLRSLQDEVYDHSRRWLQALPFFSRVSYNYYIMSRGYLINIVNCNAKCL